jgi:hypothetical protein
LPGPDGKPAPLRSDPKKPGGIGFCIAVDSVREDGLGNPLRYYIPQFGTVHLGEFYCYPNSRRLTMIRAELGCPFRGDAQACDAEGGCEPYP